MQGVELTPQEKQKFLARLAATAGNVSKAAQAAKISRSTAYEHKSKDADFSKAWDNIEEAVTDAMEQELYRRAVKGVPEPVFHKGEIVAKVRKYSDRLLEFGLKSKRPEKYRERFDVNQNIAAMLDLNIQATINQIYADPDNPEAESETESPAIDGGTDQDG
jgi:hypothetical protein